MAMSVEERAARYVAKMDASVSGQAGHDDAFDVAMKLVHGFMLPQDAAMRIFAEAFNPKCQPPWSEAEIRHKIESASKSAPSKPRGWLVEGAQAGAGTPDAGFVPTPKRAKYSPAIDLRDRIESAIEGEVSAPFGPAWTLATDLAKPYAPRSVVVLNGRQGEGKTYMLFESLLNLHAFKIPFALLALEKDRSYWLGRFMAMLEQNSDARDPDWQHNHEEEVRRIWKKHETALDEIGASIDEREGIPQWNSIANWLTERAKDGARVLAVDSVTVKAPSKATFNDDWYLVDHAMTTATKYGCSIVLLSHPPKTPGNQASQNWGDDVAGGSAYLKMVDVVFNLKQCETQEYKVKHAQGMIDLPINRQLEFRKTRDGQGAGYIVGYYFDPKTLRTREQGWMGTRSKQPKPIHDSKEFGG